VRPPGQPLGLGLVRLGRHGACQVHHALLGLDVDLHEILDTVRGQLGLHLGRDRRVVQLRAEAIGGAGDQRGAGDESENYNGAEQTSHRASSASGVFDEPAYAYQARCQRRRAAEEGRYSTAARPCGASPPGSRRPSTRSALRSSAAGVAWMRRMKGMRWKAAVALGSCALGMVEIDRVVSGRNRKPMPKPWTKRGHTRLQ